jgi:hypothetical protein
MGKELRVFNKRFRSSVRKVKYITIMENRGWKLSEQQYHSQCLNVFTTDATMYNFKFVRI